MTIFLNASIHGNKDFSRSYHLIAKKISAAGLKVKADQLLGITPEIMSSWPEDKISDYHKKLLENVKQADAVFVETSYKSTSVGYLMALAVQVGKPVVVFCDSKSDPLLFRALEEINEKVQVICYSNLEELEKELPYAIEFVLSTQDTRFNFFISPDQSSYMDWVAKNRKIPRSVYLRTLIEADMERNEHVYNPGAPTK